MDVEIGKNIRQPEGFSAFVPHAFPPKGIFAVPQDVLMKAAQADHLVGKLDGITHTLPDVEFFLKMFVVKDATSSAQIEGTQATMVDALAEQVGVTSDATDAGDILHYIEALRYGGERLKKFPMSLRLIREIHAELMSGARATHFADPGEFRKSQNFIGGTRPGNARFVPPPIVHMKDALHDYEAFLHDESSVVPLVHIALAHAQFETIHPFLDGNGRTGRLLVTLLLCQRDMLERPALFLSSYFKRHQKEYYARLQGYHDGKVKEWVEFFLEGVIETAKDSVGISKEITALRDEDMAKMQSLGKKASASGVLVLRKLFASPVVTTKTVMEWTGFSRVGAQKVIDRFVDLGILSVHGEPTDYDRAFIYGKYVEIFE